MHLVIHVMENEGMSMTLLKCELTKNHDGHHQELHVTKEMTQTECEPASSDEHQGTNNMTHQCRHVMRKCAPYIKQMQVLSNLYNMCMWNSFPSKQRTYVIFKLNEDPKIFLTLHDRSLYSDRFLNNLLLHILILLGRLIPNICVDIYKTIKNNNQIIETKCYNKLHMH